MSRVVRKKDIWLIGITSVFAVLVIGVMYGLSVIQERPFSELSRDVISIYQGRAFTGLFSNAGMILWGFATTLLFALWYMLFVKRTAVQVRRIIFVLGLVTLMLYLDDFIMIHEFVVREYLGLPEELMMVLYFVVLAAVILMRYKVLMEYGFIYLVLGILFLGGSAGFDTVYKFIYIPQIHLVEDGSKFIGICF